MPGTDDLKTLKLEKIGERMLKCKKLMELF
jgi:hypothetical protein